LLRGRFTFTDSVTEAFDIFVFVLWSWVLMTFSRDLFCPHEVSGFGKALWSISEQDCARWRIRLLHQVAKPRCAEIVLNPWN
jgi:hypothetical protein